MNIDLNVVTVFCAVVIGLGVPTLAYYWWRDRR